MPRVLTSVIANSASTAGIDYVVNPSATSGSSLQTAITTLGTTGGTILLGPGTHTWDVVPAIPPNITGRLAIRGPSAKVTLTNAAPRFVDLAYTADYQTFKNVEIADLLIDANSVGGKHHVVAGTWIAGSLVTTGQRTNITDWVFRRIRTINVPTDTSASNQANQRYNIHFVTYHPAASEATQTYVKNILVEDCDFQGGNEGVGIAGSGPAATGINIFFDNIKIYRTRHTTGSTPTNHYSSSNFQVGSRGFGGTVEIVDCYGYGSGDVGIEVNAGTHITIRDCVMEDTFTTHYYQTNYNYPATGGGAAPSAGNTTVNSQRVVWDRCVSRRVNVVQTTTDGRAHYVNVNLSVPTGRVVVRDCELHSINAPFPASGQGVYIGAAAKSVHIEGFTANIEGVATAAASAAITPNIFHMSSTANPVEYTVRRCKVKVSGTRDAAAGTCSFDVFNLSTTSLVLDVDDVSVDYNITGLSAASTRVFNVGAATTTLRGTIRRLKVLGIADDTTPKGIQIRSTSTLTITPALRIEDCDFAGMPAGGVEVSFADNTNKPFVYLRGINWITFPKPSAAAGSTTFASSSFTSTVANQYIGGEPADLHFLRGSGAAVTVISASKDGVTYEEMYNQSSGAMANDVVFPVDNGDYVKITFATTQPTTRVRFRR